MSNAAYKLFCEKERANVIKHNPNKNIKTIGKILTAEWQALSKEERAQFFDVKTQFFDVKSEKTAIIELLLSLFIKEIECALTIGRSDNELEPFSEDKINTFIEDHMSDILDRIHSMYNCYEEDGELEDLKNPENDWIREVLFDEDHTIGELLLNLQQN
jgi:hypothetical protein